MHLPWHKNASSSHPAAASEAHGKPVPCSSGKRFAECFNVFLRLGLTSFGGPVAHLTFFRSEVVARLQWVNEIRYAELVALCQVLPGPASSQTGFGLGYLRGGFAGAMGAWIGFTLPSALFMILFAYTFSRFATGGGWIHGLKLAAAAVVLHALIQMAQKLCPNMATRIVAIVSTALMLISGTAWMQVALIGLGILWGIRFSSDNLESTPPNPHPVSGNQPIHGRLDPRSAPFCIVAFGTLLLSLPILTGWFALPWLEITDTFYRSGALVFGGGHVVLPLLEKGTVGANLVSREAFLAGYGAAQTVPGPIFTFGAFLGTLMTPGPFAWAGGLYALTVLLLPSFLLVAGILPNWEKLRNLPWFGKASTGASAVVVGLLAAAFYDPVLAGSVHSLRSGTALLIGFVLLQWLKCPSWVLVPVFGVTAQLLS